jgi:hypothetical protein
MPCGPTIDTPNPGAVTYVKSCTTRSNSQCQCGRRESRNRGRATRRRSGSSLTLAWPAASARRRRRDCFVADNSSVPAPTDSEPLASRFRLSAIALLAELQNLLSDHMMGCRGRRCQRSSRDASLCAAVTCGSTSHRLQNGHWPLRSYGSSIQPSVKKRSL